MTRPEQNQPPSTQRRGPMHHPDEGVLMDFASGAVHEAGAVLIATHLALCAQCRDRVRTFETLGGALIDDLPPSELAEGSRDALMAKLDVAPISDAPRKTPASSSMPEPLRGYLGNDLNTLPWKRISPSIEQVEIALHGREAAVQERMRLLRIKPGSAITRHTHRGTEMVLVLSGGFRDGSAQFLPGDFALSDQHVDHTPQVDADGCICLSVTDAPLRFTGLFGRILNLFVRF